MLPVGSRILDFGCGSCQIHDIADWLLQKSKLVENIYYDCERCRI